MNAQQLEKTVKDSLPAIIVAGEARVLVQRAEELGKELGKRQGPLELTTNQIRAIFGTVRQIDMAWTDNQGHQAAVQRLVLLKPKMMYRAAREGTNRGKGLRVLANVLSAAIDLVVDPQEKAPEQSRAHFTNFVNFFEAILAYHRVAGGS